MKIPAIFSDGMVLEKNSKIWGFADAGESVTITFLEKEYIAIAGQDQRWEINITADDFGGPHILKIGEHIIKNVMVGYVWLCGGQSNMELPVYRVRRMFKAYLKDANHQNIRQFTVRKACDFNNQHQLYEGRWNSATVENIDSFFATAYFFARKLWDRYNIPIGLIGCAVGGSTAEAWISEEALRTFPKYTSRLLECKDAESVKNTENAYLDTYQKWHSRLDETDPGVQEHWESYDYDDSSWAERELTDSWAGDLSQNGSVWFRKTVDVPAEMVGKATTLLLGRVVNSNYVYVNGKFVGRIEYQYPPSIFNLPPDTLRAGRNIITARIISTSGLGSFVKDKPCCIESYDDVLSLDGIWKYKIGGIMPPLPFPNSYNKMPAGLYNAMLSAVIGYTVTGVIWYQGESNVPEPYDYKDLMVTLINDWRNKWGINFPFIFTQLVNFEDNSAPYPESHWAEVRMQQLLCLDVPGTAMAVGIDCGEYNDLHPLDKKTLGERLALAALKLAYGEDIIYSGPIIQEAVADKDIITISFSHTASGLKSAIPGEALKGFEIIDKNGAVHNVSAEIDGSKVLVKLCEGIVDPAFIRYAWADNPYPSLYNSEGLPASPFKLKLGTKPDNDTFNGKCTKI